MTTFQKLFFLIVALFLSGAAEAATSMPATADLEKQIAWQQGRFGALYDHCGSFDERSVIGGSLSSWRMETFRGYKGSPEERLALETIFDNGAASVVANKAACDHWVQLTAATWHSILDLSHHGFGTTVAP